MKVRDLCQLLINSKLDADCVVPTPLDQVAMNSEKVYDVAGVIAAGSEVIIDIRPHGRDPK